MGADPRELELELVVAWLQVVAAGAIVEGGDYARIGAVLAHTADRLREGAHREWAQRAGFRAARGEA